MKIYQICTFSWIFFILRKSVFTLFISLLLFQPMANAETSDIRQGKIFQDKVKSKKLNSEAKNPEWKLTEEQWDLVKQGEQLLKMPVMQQVVDRWSSLSSVQAHAIELRYPGGEEGQLWVEELKDNLISMGIPSKYLIAVPGSGEADIIIFKLFKVGDL